MPAQTSLPAKERLIVALDFPTAEAAARMADRLHGRVGMFKVGSELFTAEGPVLVRYLLARGERVFLDLKFHDIPNTVRAAAREAAQLGVSMFNVHASGGRKMMEAALEGVRSAGRRRPGASPPLVLAVAVLTSLDARDLSELGLADDTPEDFVVRLARLAQKAGLDGVVASPREVAALRRACGPRFAIITPGIRPAASGAGGAGSVSSDDQTRFTTPEYAIQAGADYLVVGRPITEAPNTIEAAEAIVKEMEQGASRASVSKP